MYISTVRGFHLGQLNYHRRDENVTYREWTRKRERERSIGLVGMRTYICLIYEAKRESWYDACYYDARDARRRLAGSRDFFFFFFKRTTMLAGDFFCMCGSRMMDGEVIGVFSIIVIISIIW